MVGIDSLREKVYETFDAYGIMPKELWNQAIEEYDISQGPFSMFLFSKGYIKDSSIGRKFAQEWNIEFVDIDKNDIDPSVKGIFPLDVIRSWPLLPIRRDYDSGAILAVLNDPLDALAIDILDDTTGIKIVPIFSDADQINEIIQELYPKQIDEDEMPPEAKVSLSQRAFLSDADNSDAPIIRLIEEIIMEACQRRSSDIHIEPFADFVRIRFRIDGVLREIDRFSNDLHGSMVTRIKIMSNMNIAEKRLPQDGRILFDKSGINVDLRVSVINTRFGETVVIRILDKSRGLMKLSDLGMDESQIEVFRKAVNLPYGMVLVTGPTGSGKSTTLYAALSEIDQSRRKVITVEDPVEYHLAGINQVQVRPIVGLTFANALRSILRQSPDVIMVGEIRDKETAQIAIQAALTGHLVLSTLHTNDAPSAITRLVEMGIPSYLVASSVVGVVAQRLVRRLCESCKFKGDGDEGTSLWQSQGCVKCDETGFKGRVALFEILEISSRLQDSIARGDNASELRFIAEQEGMRSLRDDGLLKAEKGITSISEVMRVIS